MSDANEQAQESYLKISSPSFSLELEGNPKFIMQSYDMVREDVLRRLMELIQKAPLPQGTSGSLESLESSAPEPPTDASDHLDLSKESRENAAIDEKALTAVDLHLPPEITGRPSGSFRATPPSVGRSNNMRDIKARMASKQPSTRPAPAPSSQSGQQLAPQNTPQQPSQQQPPQQQPVQSAQLNTQASIQVDIPAQATAKDNPQSTFVSPERASKSHYIWIYITHQAYNKVYVADLNVFEKAPTGAFLDGRRVRKMYLESVALASFKPLFGEGHTMWAEPSPTRAKSAKPPSNQS